VTVSKNHFALKNHFAQWLLPEATPLARESTEAGWWDSEQEEITFLAALAAAAFASLWVRRSFLRRLVLHFLLSWCMIKKTWA
jgi:hypothetical protein